MKRALLFVLLVSVGLNIGLAVSLHRSREAAHAPYPRFEPGHGEPVEARPGRPGRFGRDKMHHLYESLSPELAEHRRAVHEARLALREAMGREDVDEAEIMARVRDMVAAQGRVDSLVASRLVQTLSELSPEERREVLERMPWMRRGLRGRGRGAGPGSP